MSQAPHQDMPAPTVVAAEPHAHMHVHVHARAAAPARKAKLSLLQLSAAERLGFVLILLTGLWALVFWALH